MEDEAELAHPRAVLGHKRVCREGGGSGREMQQGRHDDYGSAGLSRCLGAELDREDPMAQWRREEWTTSLPCRLGWPPRLGRPGRGAQQDATPPAVSCCGALVLRQLCPHTQIFGTSVCSHDNSRCHSSRIRPTLQGVSASQFPATGT